MFGELHSMCSLQISLTCSLSLSLSHAFHGHNWLVWMFSLIWTARHAFESLYGSWPINSTSHCLYLFRLKQMKLFHIRATSRFTMWWCISKTQFDDYLSIHQSESQFMNSSVRWRCPSIVFYSILLCSEYSQTAVFCCRKDFVIGYSGGSNVLCVYGVIGQIRNGWSPSSKTQFENEQ